MGLQTVEQLNECQFGTKICESLMKRFETRKSWEEKSLLKEVMENLDYEHYVKMLLEELQGKGLVVMDNQSITFKGA